MDVSKVEYMIAVRERVTGKKLLFKSEWMFELGRWGLKRDPGNAVEGTHFIGGAWTSWSSKDGDLLNLIGSIRHCSRLLHLGL